MSCPDCGVEPVVFAVPEAHRDHVPGAETAVGLCPDCLLLRPAADPPAEPDFDRVHDSFPTEGEAAVPMALLVGLLDELALYRSEVTALLTAVERAGTDPLLVLSRLAAAPELDPDADIQARRTQLEQLL